MSNKYKSHTVTIKRDFVCQGHVTLFSAQEGHLTPSSGDGRGLEQLFLHKHLREVCRSDAMETLVNEETQLEVDS